MNILKKASLLILATMFISNVAIAEGEKLADKLSKASIAVTVNVQGCDADAAILCPGLPSNSKKSFMCLMAYEDNLSMACKVGIIEAALTLKAGIMAIEHSAKACEIDADKYCLKVKPGSGRIVSCLRKNEANLNKECTAALKETVLWDLGDK
jgi:hypothetical protein